MFFRTLQTMTWDAATEEVTCVRAIVIILISKPAVTVMDFMDTPSSIIVQCNVFTGKLQLIKGNPLFNVQAIMK